MSVSEREQAKPAHRERRMAIMNEVHDIIGVSEREQAKPAHRERRMAIMNKENTGKAGVIYGRKGVRMG
ncbi:MAG: hypothetical protein J6A08_11315 [Lachnospiraceae bacterium]|nr:hypothetical protein [Lachnospiraceae bacterium]